MIVNDVDYCFFILIPEKRTEFLDLRRIWSFLQMILLGLLRYSVCSLMCFLLKLDCTFLEQILSALGDFFFLPWNMFMKRGPILC